MKRRPAPVTRPGSLAADGVPHPDGGFATPLAWALPLLANCVVMLRCWGAPLGEPVADDFDFIVARLTGHTSFWSGGGSSSFWRPIPHQGYYMLMAPHLYSSPWVVPLLHATALCGIGYLLVLALRHRLGLMASSLVAAFFLLSEPVRSLLSWPSHFVEIGLLLGLATALFAAEAGWILLAACAFACALLCKESALLALPLLALVPARGSRRETRWPLRIVLVGTSVAWVLAYAHARSTYHLVPPASITLDPALLVQTASVRIAWAFRQCVMVALGLNAQAPIARLLLALAYSTLAALAVAIFIRRPRSASVRFDRDAIRWLCLWIALFTVGLTATYPIWASYRALIVTLGVGALVITVLQPIHRLLPAGLVGLKFVALLVAVGTPARVGVLPPTPGTFLDYQQLVRLQILMRDTRRELQRAYPTLPPRSLVVQRDFPYQASYALGGSSALRAWYADTTLVWMGYDAYQADTLREATCMVEFEDRSRPAVSIVPGRALTAQLAGDAALAKRDTLSALALFDRAMSYAAATSTPTFEASCRYRRAICLAGLGRLRAAENEVRLALRSPLYERSGRFLLALVLADEGRLQEALRETESSLATDPGDDRAGELRISLLRAIQGGRR